MKLLPASGEKALAIAPGGNGIAFERPDHSIEIIDPRSYRSPPVLRQENFTLLSLSANGQRFVATDRAGVNVHDTAYGKVLLFIEAPQVVRASLSQDGKVLALTVDCSKIDLWNVDAGRKIKTIGSTSPYSRSPQDGDLCSMALSPDNKLIAIRGTGKFTLWDTDTMRELSPSTDPGKVLSVAFSPNGKFLVTGGFEGTFKIWDSESFHLLKDLTPHPTVKTLAPAQPQSLMDRFQTLIRDAEAKTEGMLRTHDTVSRTSGEFAILLKNTASATEPNSAAPSDANSAAAQVRSEQA